MDIYRVISRSGSIYELGEPVGNTDMVITGILLVSSAGSTRICQVMLDNGNYVEVNDPLEIWYMPK